MNSYEREIERQKQQQYTQIMKRLAGPLLLSGAACLFGTVPVIQQNTFDFIPPWTFVWLRYLLACLTLGALVKINAKLKKTDASETTVAENRPSNPHRFTIFFIVAFTGYFATVGGAIVGARVTSQPEASLLTSLVPVLLFVGGIVLLRERFEIKQIIAILISIIGAVVLILKDGKELPDFGPTTRSGDFWLILSSIMWTYQAVVVKKYGKQESPLVLTFYSFVIALVLTTPLMVIELWKQGKILSIWQDIFSGDLPTNSLFIYLGVFATAAAYYMWTRGIITTDLSTGCIVLYFQLLVSTILRWVYHQDNLGTSFIVGGIVLIISMYWMLRESGEQSEHEQSEREE